MEGVTSSSPRERPKKQSVASRVHTIWSDAESSGGEGDGVEQPLSPQAETGEQAGGGVEGDHTEANPDGADTSEQGQEGEEKSKKKKILKRTMPKLDANKLKNPERGFPALPKMLEKAKFRGKGHEASDLNLLLSHLHHWGHRLLPNVTFGDLTERLERLGQQKIVQNCVGRMRLGLPVTDEDYALLVEKDNESDDNAEPPRDGDVNEEDLDDLIREAELSSQTTDVPSTPPPPPAAAAESNTLTEEQMERMRQNRLKALEKRQKLLSSDQMSMEVSQHDADVYDPYEDEDEDVMMDCGVGGEVMSHVTHQLDSHKHIEHEDDPGRVLEHILMKIDADCVVEETGVELSLSNMSQSIEIAEDAFEAFNHITHE